MTPIPPQKTEGIYTGLSPPAVTSSSPINLNQVLHGLTSLEAYDISLKRPESAHKKRENWLEGEENMFEDIEKSLWELQNGGQRAAVDSEEVLNGLIRFVREMPLGQREPEDINYWLTEGKNALPELLADSEELRKEFHDNKKEKDIEARIAKRLIQRLEKKTDEQGKKQDEQGKKQDEQGKKQDEQGKKLDELLKELETLKRKLAEAEARGEAAGEQIRSLMNELEALKEKLAKVGPSDEVINKLMRELETFKQKLAAVEEKVAREPIAPIKPRERRLIDEKMNELKRIHPDMDPNELQGMAIELLEKEGKLNIRNCFYTLIPNEALREMFEKEIEKIKIELNKTGKELNGRIIKETYNRVLAQMVEERIITAEEAEKLGPMTFFRVTLKETEELIKAGKEPKHFWIIHSTETGENHAVWVLGMRMDRGKIYVEIIEENIDSNRAVIKWAELSEFANDSGEIIIFANEKYRAIFSQELNDEEADMIKEFNGDSGGNGGTGATDGQGGGAGNGGGTGNGGAAGQGGGQGGVGPTGGQGGLTGQGGGATGGAGQGGAIDGQGGQGGGAGGSSPLGGGAGTDGAGIPIEPLRANTTNNGGYNSVFNPKNSGVSSAIIGNNVSDINRVVSSNLIDRSQDIDQASNYLAHPVLAPPASSIEENISASVLTFSTKNQYQITLPALSTTINQPATLTTRVVSEHSGSLFISSPLAPRGASRPAVSKKISEDSISNFAYPITGLVALLRIYSLLGVLGMMGGAEWKQFPESQ